MIQCQCPKCWNRFQAPEQNTTSAIPCPECRFQVEIPRLDMPASSASPRPGIVVECPWCRMKFPVTEKQVGTTLRCPDCSKPVRIPSGHEKGSRVSQAAWIALGILVLLLVGLSQVSILGSNANSAFNTVGKSI